MAPKRKGDIKQPTLEEVTETPTVKKRTKKRKLTEPEVKKGDASTEDLVRAKLARKHGNDPAFQGVTKKDKDGGASAGEAHAGEKPNFVEINRAPVLTAWVAAVAEREGHSRTAGLTFGKAVAGMLAQSKGRSIGVYDTNEEDEARRDEKNQHEKELGVELVDVFGMSIKALRAEGELRALESGSNHTVDPSKVQQYLKRAFNNRLDDVEAVLSELAESFPADEIGSQAYRLYEHFRPSVAQGKQGWGRKGRLEFDRISELKPSG